MNTRTVKIGLFLYIIILVLANTVAVAQDLTGFYRDGVWEEYTFERTYLQVNGKLLDTDVPPLIFNDYSVVPARAVFEQLGAQVSWDGSKNQVTVSLYHTDILLQINSDIAIVNGNPHQMALAAKNINDRTMIPTRFVAETLGMDVDWIGEQRLITIDYSPQKEKSDGPTMLNGVDFMREGDKHIVTIQMDFLKQPYVFRLSNPERIVIDIPHSTLAISEKIDVIDDGIITNIRYGQFDDDTTRVVLDVIGKPMFEIAKAQGKIKVMLSRESYQNIYYSNNEGPQFMIYHHVIGEGDAKVVGTKNRYMLSIPISAVDLGEGRMDINDQYVEFVDIVKNVDTSTTDIIFKTKTAYDFNIKPAKDGTKTIVSMQMPTPEDVKDNPSSPHEDEIEGVLSEIELDPKAKDKIVVLDPGHGGSDPGAIYGGVMEKDLNLDISLRLYELLKQGGVQVYMTRTDDRFIPLETIAEYANQLDATLFLSIHNNAWLENRNYDGTMMFYFPSPVSPYYNISGRQFAQILQTEVVTRLGTTDRSIRQGPTYAVLKNTNMPAVLAEIAFMSNPKDLENLKTEAFRQTAAEALYVGIVKALNETVMSN